MPRPPRHRSIAQRVTVGLIVTCVTWMTTQLTTSTAYAEKARDLESLLWAARVCYLEATWRESDCIALLWVTEKRARRAARPWLDMLRQYSAIGANNQRARETRAFPWGDIADKSASFNQRWRRLRELVVEFAEGKRPNPCPRAEHWGGPMDHPHGRMVPARCAVSTVNTFYAVHR